ncbi:MAG: DUF2235 domain-containing protein, partial [Candidatus Heimdallarchaeota archaeon]|nr:DUF2235 domain-containing protein [Candidatus Heimdallarchaeota archaeon]
QLKMTEDEIWNDVEQIYNKSYRHKENIALAKLKFHPGQDYENGKVFFLGVWDTVGALGIPNDLALLNLLDNEENYNFHDHSLNENVEHARHAIAIDEVRASFSPTLWENIREGHDVKQVWFPGVHSDVGGGYLEKGLSDGALKWMIDEAKAEGLKFNSKMCSQITPDYKDVMHNSYSGGFKLLHTQPRSIPQISADNQLIHSSAFLRQTDPPITQTPYRKTRLIASGQSDKVEIFARERWNNTGIYLEFGEKYSLRAHGQWLDRKIKCGPNGSDDGKFQLGELAQMAGSLLGEIEKLYKWITKNKEGDFIGTRREEKYPWFSLIGIVANGDNPKKNETLPVHDTFLIGEEYIDKNDCKEFSPQKSGYLYCFANDAWHF